MVGFVLITILRYPRPWFLHFLQARLQNGILALTVFKLSAESAMDRKHMVNRMVSLGCRALHISKLSAHLPRCAASRVLCPIPNLTMSKSIGDCLSIVWMQRFCLEHFAETIEDLLVVFFSMLECEFRSHCPQEEIHSGRCAIQQQQPCCLHVGDLWDHLEQTVMLQPFLGRKVLNVVRMSQWCPPNT